MPFSSWLHPLSAALAAAALAAAAAPAQAGPLADPTRPPAWVAPAASAAPARGTVGRAPAAEPRPQPRLQSVQLPEGGAASAVIDGRVVKVGDPVGDAVVVAIDADGLVLRNGKVTERVWLFAAEGKRPAGSLVESRSARFTPAAGDARTASAPPAAPNPPAAPPAATVSLAGKATP